MKKKYLILLLVFALCLVGCGGSKEEKESSTDSGNTIIDNSKRETFFSILEEYANAVSFRVNEGMKLSFFTTKVLYLVPIGNENGKTCVSVETGGNSPFSDKWNWAYVGVMFDNDANRYTYYVIAEDGAGNGISFSKRNEINDMYQTSKSNEKGYRLLKELYNQNNNKVYRSSSDYDELKAIMTTEIPYDTIAVVGAVSGNDSCRFSSSDLY